MSEHLEIFEYLILSGAIQVAGIDPETGEILYSFTPKVKEIMPELYNEHINSINKEVMNLWEMGFVNIDFFSDDPLVTLTEKSFNEEEVAKLSKSDKWSLQELKRLLKIEEL